MTVGFEVGDRDNVVESFSDDLGRGDQPTRLLHTHESPYSWWREIEPSLDHSSSDDTFTSSCAPARSDPPVVRLCMTV